MNAKVIENSAFVTAVLETVRLGADIEKIDPQAFNGYAMKSYEVDEQNSSYKAYNGILYSKDGKELISCPMSADAVKGRFEVPEGVETIRDYAFSYCDGLEEVSLPTSVTTIGNNAFDSSGIKNIDLPDTLTEIGESAFVYCFNLQEVTIPSNIKTLSKNVFKYCASLSSVTLNEGVKEIGDWAFAYCAHLRELHLPDSLAAVNGSAFYECGSAEELTEEALEVMEEQEQVDDMESYDEEEENAEHSRILDAYNASVAGAGESGGLTFVLNENNPYFSIGTDGNLYSKDGTSLIAMVKFSEEQYLQIPDSISSLEDYSVLSSKLTEVEIPASVTTIKDNAVGYFQQGSRYVEFRIYGTEGSVAQSYAQKCGLGFFTGPPEANAAEISLSCGETFQYTISNTPEGVLVFASSDNLIASVDQNGLITAKANGTAEIFAVNGSNHFSILVTVTGGGEPVDPYASYQEFSSSEELEAWEESYDKYNADVPMSLEDNININDYSSNNYVAIKAKLIGGAYIQICDSAFEPGGYEQFETVTRNLYHELERFRLNSNLKIYSGTMDISFITGGDSSLEELLDSVGKEVTDPCVISTSLDHGVAAMHGDFVMEIYAPRDLANGAYIDSISEYQGEYELLLNYGLTYKVIDAGIRNAVIDAFPDKSGETYTTREYYVKLLLNPQPDPVEPVEPVNPDTPSDPGQPSGPDVDNPGSQSENRKNRSPKTGDCSDLTLWILLFISSSGLMAACCTKQYRNRRREWNNR